MSEKIDRAIADLRSRSGAEYRATRSALFDAQSEHDMAGRKVAALGERQYSFLERYIIRALKPHSVEWRYAKSRRLNGHDVRCDDWTCSAHFYGEVYPAPAAGKFSMQMRVTLPFNMTPRDGAELLRMVAAIKAAADALRDGGL